MSSPVAIFGIALTSSLAVLLIIVGCICYLKKRKTVVYDNADPRQEEAAVNATIQDLDSKEESMIAE